MKTLIYTLSLLGLLMVLMNGCEKEKDETESGIVNCGEGSGYSVDFCRQVNHYEAGFGVEGEDEIVVNCLVGPENATVSNQENGTYYCAGTYKLNTFDDAEISLNWGGSTNYSCYEECQVLKGAGSFSIKVTKQSGGSGNLFLSMCSGSSWMFDVVPVNTDCNLKKKFEASSTRADAPMIIQNDVFNKIVNCMQNYDSD